MLMTLPRPPSRKRQRAFGARHSLFCVHFYISIPLSGPSLKEFLDPPLDIHQPAPNQPVLAHTESACLAHVEGEQDGDTREGVGDWRRAHSSTDASLSKVQTRMRSRRPF